MPQNLVRYIGEDILVVQPSTTVTTSVSTTQSNTATTPVTETVTVTTVVPETPVTNQGVVTTVTEDLTIYIPAIDLSFSGSLFKPNTRLYVFFDGVNVTNYIEPIVNGTSQGIGYPLVTDKFGYVNGVFHLPNNSSRRFLKGVKELKFTNSSKNGNDETTFASVYFTYSGSTDLTATQDTAGSQAGEIGIDPIVQSFNVIDKGGVYLNKVDLYFCRKDPQYAVLFQIREVENDTVSNSYLTDSSYVIQPTDIHADSNGATATTVTLNNPVFLQEGKEYAIYLSTAAPATYALATCVYGETNSLNQLSTRDPRIGSYMKHLGTDSWLRDNSKGIKFVIHKAKFDTASTYTLALDNDALGMKTLPNNSLSTNYGTHSITVTDAEHSFNAGDYVTISGLPDDTTYSGINSDYINGVHRIDSVTWNTYSFSTVMISGSETAIPGTATDTSFFGTNVSTDYAYQYNNIQLNNNQILLSDTDISYTFVGLSGRSLDGYEAQNVFDQTPVEISNQVLYKTNRVKKIASDYNEINLNPGGKRSLQVNVLLRTNNENITPVIDKYNTNAILTENLVNYPDDVSDELTTDNGVAVARYITKDISLSEISNGLQVKFFGNLQGDSEVKVYYKVLPIDTTDSLVNQPWTEMTLDSSVARSTSDNIYSAYTYSVFDLPMFKAFKTKIIMLSSDSSKVPLIKKYQAIALQTMSI